MGAAQREESSRNDLGFQLRASGGRLKGCPCHVDGERDAESMGSVFDGKKEDEKQEQGRLSEVGELVADRGEQIATARGHRLPSNAVWVSSV